MTFINNIAVISTGIAHGDSHLIYNTSIDDAQGHQKIDCKYYNYSAVEYLNQNMDIFEPWIECESTNDIRPDEVFKIIMGFTDADRMQKQDPDNDYFIVIDHYTVGKYEVFTDNEMGEAEAYAFVNSESWNTEIIDLKQIRADITNAVTYHGFSINTFLELEEAYQECRIESYQIEITFEAARKAVTDVYNIRLRNYKKFGKYKKFNNYIKWLFAE